MVSWYIISPEVIGYDASENNARVRQVVDDTNPNPLTDTD